MVDKLPSSTIPVPDPTKLTTEAVDRAKIELVSYFDSKIQGHKDLIEQKFVGVATEFTMRDIALAAAFKAAEAAVKQQNESNTLAIDKAGTAFTKQIDGLDEKINDLKERVSEFSSKNYAAIGGYIIGCVGVISLIIAILKNSHTFA